MAWTQAAVAGSKTKGETLMVLKEIVVDDSDKTLDFDTDINPAGGGLFEVLGIRIEYLADGTVATRRINVEVGDSTPDVLRVLELATTALVASADIDIDMAPGHIATVGTDVIYEAMPAGLTIGSGQTLRVFDKTASAAAGDDMVVIVTGMLRK